MLFGSIFCYELCLQSWCASERNKHIEDIDYVNYSPNYHFANLGMFSYYTQEARQAVFDKGASIDDIRAYLTSASALQDDFTGFFSNEIAQPNVFVILIEAGDEVMFYKDPAVANIITPNLSKFLTNGIHCNRNSSINHTNVSDVIGITGSYPQY
ncbi:MAG: hypothetical protein MJ195_02110 [Mycoplasmoidaceae bacterium]|nr:hypothetical protein [Mycoplasmoidaceae bacterium]